MMIAEVKMIKMMCISYWSLLNNSFCQTAPSEHTATAAVFYNTSATVGHSWAEPWSLFLHRNLFKDPLIDEIAAPVFIKIWEKFQCETSRCWEAGMFDLKESHKEHQFSLQTKGTIWKLYPHLQIFYTAHICLHQSKHICAVIWMLPTTNPSPATLLGWSDGTYWIHGIPTSAVRCMNSDPTHAPFCIRLCP